MECKHIQKKLLEYIDGILSYEDSELVESHIAECDSCRREIELFYRLSGIICKVDYPPASIWGDFLFDLHKRIDREALYQFAKEQKHKTYAIWGWAFASVAAIIFLITSIFLEYRIDSNKNYFIAKPEIASKPVYSNDYESYVIADIVSKAFINDKNIVHLKKLQKINEYSIFSPPSNNYYFALPEPSEQPKTNSEDRFYPSLYDSLDDYDYIDTAEYYVSVSGSL